MKARRLLLAFQVLAIIGIGLLCIVLAASRARSNTLASFANYRATWSDAWRAPVEHLAVEALGRLLTAPETDPVMARAAMGVMRQSSSWIAMAPEIRNHLRGVLDARLNPRGEEDALRIAWELFALSEPSDLELYRERIVALGGDRTNRIEAVQAAAAALQMADDGSLENALIDLSLAWDLLLNPLDDRALPWLARLTPAFIGAEYAAHEALLSTRRRLLEPYGLRSDATYGGMQPDRSMLVWLDQQARTVNQDDPTRRLRLAEVDRLMRRHQVPGDEEPVVAIATRIALRHDHLPWTALLMGLGVVSVLFGGLTIALIRLRRGPLPIDVNAETMENVEPIDLDTDAETRSRSSGSITDVG